MHITIDRADLTKALWRVQGTADRKATMPIVAHVLLEADEGGLTVSATDLDMALIGKYDADVATAGRMTVNARHFYDIVKSLPVDRITLKRQSQERLDIQAGASEFHLVGLNADEFPALPEVDVGALNELPAAAVLKLIDCTLFCVSTDENRHSLSGIFWEAVDGDMLRLVTTDGHRLALCEKNFDKALTMPANGVLLPRKACVELRRLLADSQQGDGKLAIAFGSHGAMFTAGAVTLTTRLIDGQFPDYRQVIPKASSLTAVVNRVALMEAVKRVALFSSGRAHGIRMAFSSGELELVAEDPALGDARETLPITYDGKALQMGFNARYILDILNIVAEDEVRVQLTDDLSPGILRPAQDQAFTAVVMPMRV